VRHEAQHHLDRLRRDWLAIGHIFTGIALCVTIIGIPLGVANFKMIPISLMPLGNEIVPA
jgi:uncharacterized membrane protein YccF (DUF307 family)